MSRAASGSSSRFVAARARSSEVARVGGDLDEGTEHDGIDGALPEMGDGRERCLGG